MTVAVPEDPTVAHVAAALGERYTDRHLLADAASRYGICSTPALREPRRKRRPVCVP
ncbi:hypothetical protein OHB12_05325 [Nocardia sp. NBC_01730]|uniref:hypothetical protein n=1 Tax=Nocardia sp. NBC_01730 TaxID=2975998 RepID=UPI002E1261E9|nr:hypothetical protein OHB12_05325 [Nocardia sp. NBC_01730]